MCWLVTCPAGKDIPTTYVDKAEKINKDGYGVAWFENNQVSAYKTMNYEEFKVKLATLTAFPKVVHLRYTSMGKTNLENSHPFEVGNGGYLFHNGTLSSMKTVACTTTCDDNSDTRNLAEVIKLCKWERISDILPLIHQITGKSGNKLVFMEANGEITIVNKNLGVEEDGIWYSNEYHVTKTYDYTNYNRTYGSYYDSYLHKNKTETLTKVFVYGTLKRGGSNHSFLKSSKFLGEATSIATYAMIGEGMPFPYLLRYMHKDEGGLIINGEVFEVDNSTLFKLDALEGVPTHYRKQSLSVKLGEKHEIVTCYFKATVSPADLAKPFIAEFKVPAYRPFQVKTEVELDKMSKFELINFLSELEEEVYGNSYTSSKYYKIDREDIIDEIMTTQDYIIYPTTQLALGYNEYLDD